MTGKEGSLPMKKGESSATAKLLHPAYSVTNIQNKVRVLDGEKVTYSSWTKLFTLHCKGYKVLQHIDGTKPPATTDPAHKSWVEIVSIVLQWIYGTLSDDLTARDAWKKIHDIFLNNKGSRATVLEAEFTNLTLSACSSLREYCQKLKGIAEQLKDVERPIDEKCLVTQLVRGLPSEYDITASLINQSSPSWDVALGMLQLEQQR